MKYIKTYELIWDDFYEESKSPPFEYEIKQYVKIHNIIDIKNGVFEVVSREYNKYNQLNQYLIKMICSDFTFTEFEPTLKKLTKEEQDQVDIFIDTKKYNL